MLRVRVNIEGFIPFLFSTFGEIWGHIQKNWNTFPGYSEKQFKHIHYIHTTTNMNTYGTSEVGFLKAVLDQQKIELDGMRSQIYDMETTMAHMSGAIRIGKYYKDVADKQRFQLERQAAEMEALRAENQRLREEKEAAEAIAKKPNMEGLLEAIVDQQQSELGLLREEVWDLKNKNAELQMEIDIPDSLLKLIEVDDATPE